MKLITLNEWLLLFDIDDITFDEFKTTYKVKTNDRIVYLNEIIKKKQFDINTIKLLYSYFVVNKKTYLTGFYNYSLKIPSDLNLSAIEFSLNNFHNIKYKNLIRNLYYKELLLDTQTGIPNLRSYLDMLLDLFNNRIIDYKLITPSAIALYKRKRFGSVLSGYYFRSSILNPSVIYTLSKQYLQNVNKVFTPTLGWSSYLYGFLSNENVKEYVGIDVIPKVCYTTQEMANELFPDKKVDIYCSPSESFLANQDFLTKYTNHFDIVFFSPPYYELELYPDPNNNQSTTLYKTYSEWLEKYWENTIKLCNLVLKTGGKIIYIISDYDTKKTLCDDMNKVTNKYFTYVDKMSLANNTKNKESRELIFLYEKNINLS